MKEGKGNRGERKGAQCSLLGRGKKRQTDIQTELPRNRELEREREIGLRWREEK